MQKPSITIRMGAAHHDVTVDGARFDLTKLNKRETTFLKNVVIDTLVKVGTISRRVPA